jgi:hypothetical protein
MRLRLLLCTAAFVVGASAASAASTPPTLEAAVRNFRADGAPGWSFRQTTVAGGKSLVERFEAGRPDFERWSLLEKDGRLATEDEQRDYREKQTRRSRGGTAPKITDSLDLATAELVTETPEEVSYRCRLRRTEAGDTTAEYLRATVFIHKPTQVIERFELSNIAPFSPAMTVKIREMKTVMSFSRPTADRPSLLVSVTTRLRGQAFFFKSLDEDLTVTCTDHTKASSKR